METRSHSLRDTSTSIYVFFFTFFCHIEGRGYAWLYESVAKMTYVLVKALS